MSVGWVAAGISLVGTVAGASAAEDAEDAQYKASKDAQSEATAARLAAEKANAPFLAAGTTGVNRLQELLGLGENTSAPGYGSLNEPFKFSGGDFSFDSSNLASDPGYQFQLKAGENALARRGAAGGGFYSGEALKDASTFNQGLASTTFGDAYNRASAEYGNAYNRENNAFQTNRANILNPLQSLAGQGQTSANLQANTQISTANTLGSLMTNQANATGAAGIAQSNALVNGLNNGLTAWQRASYTNTAPVGPGSTFETDPSSYGAINGSDRGLYLSDRRLKTNLVRVGQTERGNAIYTWDWKTGGSDMGVIAQEVQHIPGAVHEVDGLLMVDYSKV